MSVDANSIPTTGSYGYGQGPFGVSQGFQGQLGGDPTGGLSGIQQGGGGGPVPMQAAPTSAVANRSLPFAPRAGQGGQAGGAGAKPELSGLQGLMQMLGLAPPQAPTQPHPAAGRVAPRRVGGTVAPRPGLGPRPITMQPPIQIGEPIAPGQGPTTPVKRQPTPIARGPQPRQVGRSGQLR